jgi:hypothetical protein
MLLVVVLFLSACSKSAPSGTPAPAATRVTAGLSFTLTPPESFAMLTDTERTKGWASGSAPLKPSDPRLVITRSSKVFLAVEEVRRLVPEEMIRGLDFSGVAILSTTAITIDSMPGYEVTARATSSDGVPLRVYCATVFAADGAFNVLGYTSGGNAANRIGDIRTAAHSLTVK